MVEGLLIRLSEHQQLTVPLFLYFNSTGQFLISYNIYLLQRQFCQVEISSAEMWDRPLFSMSGEGFKNLQ